MNIQQLLDRMRDYEEGALEFNAEEHAALFEECKSKIDSIKEFIDSLEDLAKRNKEYSIEFDKRAKTYQNNADGLRLFLKRAMEQHQMPFIKGNKWQVTVMRRKKLELAAKPTRAEFLKHMDLIDVSYAWVDKKPSSEVYSALSKAGVASGVVDLSYDWKEKDLQSFLEAQRDAKIESKEGDIVDDKPHELDKFAKLGETVFVQFKPKKETK